MKQCPQCKTTYTDVTLHYCLQDGTPLVGQTNRQTEMPTVALGEKTEKFSTNKLTEGFTTNKDAEQVRVHVPNPQADEWGKSQETKIIVAKPKTENSKTLTTILATALIMLILFGSGIGGYFYFSNQNEETSSNANFNSEQIKEEVKNRISDWKSQAESRSLDTYMESYADKIDYYNKKGADISLVRKDRQKAFDKYDSIKINMTNFEITPVSGEEASAVFDKQWFFKNESESSEGKVQTQLKLSKIGGRWKITSEKDLKVYYTK